MSNYLEYIRDVFASWKGAVVGFLPRVFFAIIIAVLFYFVAKLARKITLKIYQRIFHKESEVAKIISVVIYFFILVSGVFLALEVLDLDGFLTKMLAGAGIVGVIAGFAFKDIASNAFAGLLLKLQKPFIHNNWVNIDGNFGVVLKVGWITTSIKTVEGQEVFVPNQLIYNRSFTNFSTYEKRRVILKSGVSYGDDLAHVKKVSLELVQSVTMVRDKEDIDFYFTSISGSAYDFEIRFWIDFKHQVDYMEAMSELIMKTKKRFEEEDISIAYSVTTLDFGVKGGVNLFDKDIKVTGK